MDNGNGNAHGRGNGDGRMRRTAEWAVASVWMTFAARASAILAGPLIVLLGSLLGYIYWSDLTRAKEERAVNATAIALNTKLIFDASLNLARAAARLEALEKSDQRQDEEIRLLRPDWRFNR